MNQELLSPSGAQEMLVLGSQSSGTDLQAYLALWAYFVGKTEPKILVYTFIAGVDDPQPIFNGVLFLWFCFNTSFDVLVDSHCV